MEAIATLTCSLSRVPGEVDERSYTFFPATRVRSFLIHDIECVFGGMGEGRRREIWARKVVGVELEGWMAFACR